MLRNAQSPLVPAKLLLARQKRVREQLKERKLDAVLVSSPANRTHLTGWQADPESGFVLITSKKSFIITDSRYSEHAAETAVGFEIITIEEGIGPALRDIAGSEKLEKIAFESHHTDVFTFKRLKRFLKKTKLIPVVHLIEETRAVKDEIEVAKIKKAVQIADETFKHLLTFVKPGISEREVAWEMEKFMKEAGAEKLAWEPLIVASGANSSMAHWVAGETKIKKNDMVLVDFGCVYQGYSSDISRVVFVGKPTTKQVEIYNLVLAVQKFGTSLVKEGRRGETIDKKVHSFLEKRLPVWVGSKNIYHHALGHGVGLEVHEPPFVNSRRKYTLAAGNVMTVEPGIYIPGWGGVRIEDMVVVTKEGCRVLTKAPKEIKEIAV